MKFLKADLSITQAYPAGSRRDSTAAKNPPGAGSEAAQPRTRARARTCTRARARTRFLPSNPQLLKKPSTVKSLPGGIAS